MRFARLREEKRHNYLRKLAELTTQHFITNDRPNVTGLILAGSANFKIELSQSDLFDQRLVPVILKIVDVSYGGENGFNQAITLSEDALSNVKFVHEKKIISKFFEEIAMDTGMIVFGVEDTMKAIELQALDTMIVYEEIPVNRYTFKNTQTNEITVKFLNKYQEADPKHFKDERTGLELDVTECQPMADWICESYKELNCTIEFITDKSQEGF